MKLASGIAPVAQLLARGINVALGTDGAASNNRHDILSEDASRDAARQGGDRRRRSVASAAGDRDGDARGAQALGLAGPDRLSRRRQGSRPVAPSTLASSTTRRSIDPISHLVHVAGRERVTDVWVGGDRVVRDRRLTDRRRSVRCLRARSFGSRSWLENTTLSMKRHSRTNADPAELAKFGDARASLVGSGKRSVRPAARDQSAAPALDRPARRRARRASDVLDVGCGGGILAESDGARRRRRARHRPVRRRRSASRSCTSSNPASRRPIVLVAAEALAAESPGPFDIVTCMEMLEHVPDPALGGRRVRAR